MNDACTYRISVKGLVVNENRQILLAKDDQGRWDLPGGGLEHDELPAVALKREIKEETGLTVTWISQTPHYLVTAERASKRGFAALVIYQIEVDSLEFTPSEECIELRFFTVATARQLFAYPAIPPFLDCFDAALHKRSQTYS